MVREKKGERRERATSREDFLNKYRVEERKEEITERDRDSPKGGEGLFIGKSNP